MVTLIDTSRFPVGRDIDYTSGEETSILAPFPRAQLPAAYQAAFADKKRGDIVEFRIPGNGNVPFKFVVAEIASVVSSSRMRSTA